MSIFASEFPVSPNIDKAKFVAAVLAWINGIRASSVLSSLDSQEFHDDDVLLESALGETLSFKSFEQSELSIFGARHELPDSEGRRWRTECVYTKNGGSAHLRVRGQCVATNQAARIATPQKPHFITQSIEDGWASNDNLLEIQSVPHELSRTSLEIAKAIIQGEATSYLPSVYVSRNNDNSLPVNINTLAKKLSGLAHVVSEPDRRFSFELMKVTDGQNPYAGALGVFAPDGRQISRLLPKEDDTDGKQLEAACVSKSSRFMSGFAAMHGWEWQQIQEAQSRRLREEATSRSAEQLDDYIEAFDSELNAKQEQIENLKQLLAIAKAEAAAAPLETTDLVPQDLSKKLGRQLYEGEHSDRLRYALLKCKAGRFSELDARTQEFMNQFVSKTHFSGRSISLSSQIKSACRDGNQMPQQLGALLSGLGFQKTQEGKHLKFTPPSDLLGLQTEILPSTPSDSQRAGKNKGAEVIRHFGIHELK